MDSQIFLSLGSNLGNRKKHLDTALVKLVEKRVEIRCQSSLYRTEPVEYEAQPDFLNLVCEIETTLEPNRLLETCLTLEKELGRLRKKTKGPRTIDIDILFYGSRLIRTPYLTIPHPRLYERNFVLVPLKEIAPEFRDPVCGKSVRELLCLCTDRAMVKSMGALD